MQETTHNEMAKSFILLLLLSIICSRGFAYFKGKYRSKVESIRDLDGIPRDKIDWKMYTRRLNRTEQVLNGYMKIKEEVGPLELTIDLEKWVDGGFKKFLIDGITMNNICVDKHYKVIMENYNGTIPSDCIFKPQEKYLKPININDIMHKHVDVVVYGKFRVTMRFHANGRDVMGLKIVIVNEKLKQN